MIFIYASRTLNSLELFCMIIFAPMVLICNIINHYTRNKKQNHMGTPMETFRPRDKWDNKDEKSEINH